MTDFAYRLEGLTLPGGWKVAKRLTRSPEATGGNFSVGYEVVDPAGRAAFLKAIDIARAFNQPVGFVTALAQITSAHRDECALLTICRDGKMDRVVWSVAEGEVLVDHANPYSRVPYIVFEMADADIRTHDRFSKRFDVAWASRVLHHAAVGLSQLHKSDIAHQDLKPSNVLVFDSGVGARVGDLGCASQLAKPGQRDAIAFAGDPVYAPPELLYGYTVADWRVRRVGGDLYTLGSLAAFLFSKVGMTEMLMFRLPDAVRPDQWKKSYKDAMPHMRHAFSQALSDLRKDLPHEIREDLLPLIAYLCDPDPEHRGHPSNRSMRFGEPLSLERFVAGFDLIARKAERGLRTAVSAPAKKVS